MSEVSNRLDFEVNLRRCGLTVAQADQVRAEVKDSVWLAMEIEAAEKRGASKAVRTAATVLVKNADDAASLLRYAADLEG